MHNLAKTALIILALTPGLSPATTATAEWPGSGTKPGTVTPAPLRAAEWPGSGTKPS